VKTQKTAFPNTVIRASAGTGKTFQLSNRFLGLVFAGTPIDSILATTFTRKAAGEILDRVLLRLAEASLDAAKLAELSRQIGDSTLDRTRCRRALSDMVRQMHRLRISTLDSFFMQIAQSFSLELGLPPGWQIADDVVDAELQRAAVRAVLQNQTTSDVLRLMHLLTKGQASRSVGEQIASLVKSLYSYYQEAPAEAWHAIPRLKQLTPPELAGKLIALESVGLPSHQNWKKAHEKSLQDARGEAWEDFLSKGLASKIFAGETTYYKKPITQDILDAYAPLIQQSKAVILGQIANQTEATFDLLKHFDAAYQANKLSDRAMRFDDIARKLGAAEMADRLDDVLFRLDVGIAHLLLDEFQDTSPLQWRVLRPLARRAVGTGDGHSFFCVGDVKQAIYGWRGGVAEIFEAIDEELDRIEPKTLDHSWRSSQPVIDCVNQVFLGLAGNTVMQKYADAAEKWSERFAEHSTEHTAMPGYCSMATARVAAEGEDRAIVTLQHAVEEIIRLREQSPGCSIGVLVRRNAAVARLIFELRRRGIEASEEGGNPLTDSPAVELALSLLTLADHPGDTIARFHLANSPLGKVVGLSDWRDADAALRLSLGVRQSLLTAGYGPTVYQWTKQLAPSCDRRDLNRLLQLVELAYGYENQASVRADDFVTLVRRQRIQNPARADVRVMTVHQAKGLQFDIVVLPELDVGISGQPPQIVVSRPTPVGEIDRVCRYVSKDLQPLLPAAFQAMFGAHERRVVEESLCVLYVAMTRAIHALHIIVAASKPNERTIPSTWAGLLRAALADGKPTSSATTLYEHGDAQWFTKLEKKDSEQADKTTADNEPKPPLVIRLAKSPSEATRGLDRRSPSQLEGGTRISLARRLRFDVSPQLDRGTLFHAWFQQIEWLDDGRPAEDALRHIAAAPQFAGLNVDELLKKFYASLERPAIREVLCRSTYRQPPKAGAACAIHAMDGGTRWRWQVWRERPFAVRNGNTILNGAIDRLVTLCDGDRTVAADVVDFKSDVLTADDLTAVDVRVEIYRPQIEAYRLAASKLCRLAPDRISARLLFVAHGLVKSL
jgi:ATP-dependent exoDNAse (exonuclease V) beta subunit